MRYCLAALLLVLLGHKTQVSDLALGVGVS